MNSLEILATIIIVFSVIKLIATFINPKAWLAFAKKMYVNPTITSLVALILAVVVLRVLLNAGITIIDILAVMVFIMLVMVVGMARFANQLITWAEGQDMKTMMKGMWPHIAIWIVLLGWGVKELFFS